MGKIADIIKKNSLEDGTHELDAYTIYGELLDRAEKEIIKLIEQFVPKKKTEIFQETFIDGFNYAIEIMEKKIEKLRED